MSDLVAVQISFPNLLLRLMKAERRIGLFLAAQIQTNRGMLFDQEGAYNGHKKWAPLKYRQGQILSRTGTLRKSIAPYNAKGIPGPNGLVTITGDLRKKTVQVGTKIKYAAMMNWGTTGLPGGVLRPKDKQALRFKVGNKWVFAKWVKIPARRFDEWNEQDKSEVSEALKNLLTEIMNGG